MADQTPNRHRNLNDILISAIIPSYNSAEMLTDAIASVLAQTRPPDEIIVVDDGSEDGTAEVCARLGTDIHYIHQDNAGASAARNTGIEAAGGDWLAFLDADDLWDPKKLELQITALEENPEADFAVTAALAWSADTQSYHQYRYDGPLDPDVMRRQLLVRNILSGLCSSLLIRRDTIEDVGGFASGKACEDRRLAIALLEKYRAVLVDVPLIRQRPGPAHFTNPERHRFEMLSLISDHDELFSQLDPTGRLKRHARARMYERSGMHYLENGDLPTAARDLRQAAKLWPLMPNPWKVLLNAYLGRIKRPAPAENAGSV